MGKYLDSMEESLENRLIGVYQKEFIKNNYGGGVKKELSCFFGIVLNTENKPIGSFSYKN